MNDQHGPSVRDWRAAATQLDARSAACHRLAQLYRTIADIQEIAEAENAGDRPATRELVKALAEQFRSSIEAAQGRPPEAKR